MSSSPLTKLAEQERTRREILHKSDVIPPLPDVVVRVLGLLDRGDTEPDQLEETLAYDQVLVAKILCMSNSPFYGVNREVATVRESIMVLGFKSLRSLVLASSTGKFMARDYAWYGHNGRGLWRHSLAVATAARTLASLTGQTSDVREELFIAGLLHDIGKMLVAPYLNERETALPEPGQDTVTIEREAVGIDHAEAGGLVAAKWRLSQTTQDILAYHHGSDAPEHLRTRVAVVRLADAVAHALKVGYKPAQAPASIVLRADLDTLGMSETDWTEAEDTLTEAVDKALASLNVLCS